MLNYALNLDLVTLPLSTAWPAPLSLALAFNEVVLIEGAGPAVSSPLLEVAATLASPVAGNVRHWGRDAATGAPGKALPPPAPHRLYLTPAGAAAPPDPR